MRIALISFEFAGDAEAGGIGTYMRNAARMLASRGHDVEVFTSGKTASRALADGTRFNAVDCAHAEFAQAIVPAFIARHRAAPFDVAEAPEYRADAATVAEQVSDLPLVVKLHTPEMLVSLLNMQKPSPVAKARFIGGSLVRGRIPEPYWSYRRAADYELAHVRRATVIAAPCRAIVETLRPMWGGALADVDVVPNVFDPPPALLALDPPDHSDLVSFFGRREIRKGIWHFAEAVPKILRRYPAARFRIVGREADAELARRLDAFLTPYAAKVEILPGVAYDELPRYYAETGIVVAPSLWENFPNVCLEAMAAGRAVVGSSAGGMAEIVAHGETGLLVPPGSADAIADAVVALLEDPDRRFALGNAARRHVLAAYGAETIGPCQERLYRKAIARHSRDDGFAVRVGGAA